jgi:integral membrane sensor domain MASE1
MKEFNSKTAWVWLSLGIAITYAVTGRLCASVSAAVANVSWMLYIPAGLSLMTSLLWGSRVWPAIFVGELLMCLGTGQSAGDLNHHGLRKRPGRRADRLVVPRQARPQDRARPHRDVVQLLAAQVLILQPLGTVIGMLALITTGHMPPDKLAETAAAWYTANLYAQFVMAPTAIAWLRWPRPARGTAQYMELAGACRRHARHRRHRAGPVGLPPDPAAPDADPCLPAPRLGLS